jgi:hypothetical protein
MYLGGNGMNCLVEFLDEATMVCHNGNARELKRRGLESRFQMQEESEASLLGVVFTEAGAMTAAPYRVHDPDHWAFTGTGLRRGDQFGLRSLHRRCAGGASGHETDKISPHSPPNVQLLARGTNRDEGGAEMIYYPTASGGSVFSAGSICYTASVLVDDAVSRITANVLKQFLS